MRHIVKYGVPLFLCTCTTMTDRQLRQRVLSWYDEHKDDWPWNLTDDPYAIWLSETILQQTRIATGLLYYQKFLDRFPTLASLAAATVDDVLAEWQGLGYYSRARRLHAAAQVMMEQHAGKVPDTLDALRALPGVGPYTASAVGAFAYGIASTAIDGNIHRVLSRYFYVQVDLAKAKERKAMQDLADEIISSDRPGDWNRALMKIGSTICTPKTPRCHHCPLASRCQAYLQQDVMKYPLPKKKVKLRERWFHYLYAMDHQGRVYIQQRGAGDIWEGMYELPLIEATDSEYTPTSLEDWELSHLGRSEAYRPRLSGRDTRVLSHQRLYISYYELTCDEDLRPAMAADVDIDYEQAFKLHSAESGVRAVSSTHLADKPFPVSLRRYIDLQQEQ